GVNIAQKSDRLVEKCGGGRRVGIVLSVLSFCEALSSASAIPPCQPLATSLQNTPIQTHTDCCMELAAAIVRRSCGSASTQPVSAVLRNELHGIRVARSSAGSGRQR